MGNPSTRRTSQGLWLTSISTRIQQVSSPPPATPLSSSTSISLDSKPSDLFYLLSTSSPSKPSLSLEKSQPSVKPFPCLMVLRRISPSGLESLVRVGTGPTSETEDWVGWEGRLSGTRARLKEERSSGDLLGEFWPRACRTSWCSRNRKSPKRRADDFGIGFVRQRRTQLHRSHLSRRPNLLPLPSHSPPYRSSFPGPLPKPQRAVLGFFRLLVSPSTPSLFNFQLILPHPVASPSFPSLLSFR